MQSTALHAVKGMNDILPDTSWQWEWLESRARHWMAAYGYRNIRTPIVEHASLFVRGIGQATDIVEKEMYSFEDRLNGDALTLRPENTAAVVRACAEHHLLHDGPRRLYYMGPMFRHERPQRGRYRQFHQIGAEALGFSGPEADAELILLALRLFADMGLNDLELQINSLGEPAGRAAHRQALVQHLEKHQHALDEEGRRRMHTNPLRVLDSKHPPTQEVAQQAPRLLDYLDESSLQHLQMLQSILDRNGVKWTLNPRLVRGLDYYNRTVFEFVTQHLGSQGTVCGGGRYDYLFEEIGARPAPAVGWSMGMERLLEVLQAQGRIGAPKAPDGYVVVSEPDGWPSLMPLLEALRLQGFSLLMQSSVMVDGKAVMPSMKTQFKKAHASGAAFALIFGQQERASHTVSIKPLLQAGEQQCLPMEPVEAMMTLLHSLCNDQRKTPYGT